MLYGQPILNECLNRKEVNQIVTRLRMVLPSTLYNREQRTSSDGTVNARVRQCQSAIEFACLFTMKGRSDVDAGRAWAPSPLPEQLR